MIPLREDLENELRKLRKINKVLMDRVERNMDAQGGNAFSLFQTAIMLEGQVAERTEELTGLTQRLMHEISQRRETEKALLVAKAAAEQANLGKTQFLAAASHDIHQPLHAARLFLGALTDEVGTGRLRELVGRVGMALDTVTELIDALLDISKLDSGAWAVTPTSFAVAPLLTRLTEEMAPQAASFGLAIHLVPSAAIVHTDRKLFLRAMSNLVSNAIRYTRAGRILIGCRRRQGRISVEVWDTGIGIPETKLPYIFEEFRQLGAPPRNQDRGFGLGLAIVERIVRLLDLGIDVRSRVGYGSCFALRVPIGTLAEAGQEPEIARGSPLGGEFAGLCVACFDRDPHALDAMTNLFLSWGCRTMSASGLDLSLVDETHRPDLIVTDYLLDGDTRGADAILALRERYNRAIPAIVACQDRSFARRKEVEALGCGFVAKPLQPAKLRAMIGHVLDQARAD
jgi:signal transduction histidine kinase/CheY-like chemotaxis protein